MIQTGRPHLWAWCDGFTKLNLGPQVERFSFSKRLEATSGRWSATLLPVFADQGSPMGSPVALPYLAKLLRPNTVVSLGFDRPGGIMVGLVDEVRVSTTLMGSQVRQTLEVSGRDMGKALEVDTIVFASIISSEMPEFSLQVSANLGEDSPVLRCLLGIQGPQQGGAPTFLGASVPDVVKWVLENTPTMRIPAMRDTGALATGRIGEWMETSAIGTWHDAKVWSDNLDRREGSVISLVKAALDEDFYEVIVDSTPSATELPRATLTVRPKPFDEPGFAWAPTRVQIGTDWPSLKTRVRSKPNHEVRNAELIAMSLGYSDSDAFSYYSVTAEHELIGNPMAEAEGLKYPLIDLYAARKFGMRAYSARMALVAGDVSAKIDNEPSELVAEVAEARNRLFNWLRPKPWLEEGSITVLGRDDFRVGDPLLLTEIVSAMTGETGMRYYIVGVQHNWSLRGHYTCTLQVTRGHTPGLGEVISREVATTASFGNPGNWTAA